MSGVKDTFEILADEITLIRRQIDQLQRTSLNKDEAKALNAVLAESLGNVARLGPHLQEMIDARLQLATAQTRLAAVEAAEQAAKAAIENTQAESLKAAQRLSQAAGEARREAWRYFGGFWVWLASIGLSGALLGGLAIFWLQGRADAHQFGKHPGLYCEQAGGTRVTNPEERSFCAFWIDQPKEAAN